MITNATPGSTGSLVAVAINSVRHHIRSNGLKVGDVLPGEQHFAVRLGVSRAVMREAFGALAALRHIDVVNGRRARVGAIDGSVIAASLDHAVATEQVSLEDVWDVRRTLELRTAELAARHRSSAQAEAIVAHAERLATATTLEAIVSHDVAFHQEIAQATGNNLIQQIIRSFEDMMRQAVPIAWHTRTTPAQRDAVIANHLEIAAAISTADWRRAIIAMDDHFDTAVITAAVITA